MVDILTINLTATDTKTKEHARAVAGNHLYRKKKTSTSMSRGKRFHIRKFMLNPPLYVDVFTASPLKNLWAFSDHGGLISRAISGYAIRSL
jgi:hypothetical protein